MIDAIQSAVPFSAITEEIHDTKTNEQKPISPVLLFKTKERFFRFCEQNNVDPTPETPFRSASNLIAQYVAWKVGPKFGKIYPKPKRGIVFYGNVGGGKTRLVEIFRQYLNDVHGIGIPIVRTRRLIEDFNLNDGRSYYATEYRNKDIILDDLGDERDGKSYGRVWGMEDFLKDRYDIAFRRNDCLTIITTNLPGPDAIKERYSERISSRCLEMFDFVKMVHRDRRKGE